jgi:hypothetical protein
MCPTVYFRGMRRHLRSKLLLGVLLALGIAACGEQQGDNTIATAGGGTATPSASNQKLSDQESLVKYAQCMREHGIQMPDPETRNGGVSILIPKGSTKEKVDKANSACKKYMPNGGEPPKADPAVTEQLRKFAKCMRENGVPDFPDPKPGGGIMIEQGSGVNPQSPTFKAAEQKCQALRPAPPEGAGDGPTNQKGDG